MISLKRIFWGSLFFWGLLCNTGKISCCMQGDLKQCEAKIVIPIGEIVYACEKDIAGLPVVIRQVKVLSAIKAETDRHEGSLLTLDISDCGAHAVRNIIDFMRADLEEKSLTTLLQDDQRFPQVYNLCNRVNGCVKFRSPTSWKMVDKLLKKLIEEDKALLAMRKNLTIIGDGCDNLLRSNDSDSVESHSPSEQKFFPVQEQRSECCNEKSDDDFLLNAELKQYIYPQTQVIVESEGSEDEQKVDNNDQAMLLNNHANYCSL